MKADFTALLSVTYVDSTEGNFILICVKFHRWNYHKFNLTRLSKDSFLRFPLAMSFIDDPLNTLYYKLKHQNAHPWQRCSTGPSVSLQQQKQIY